MADSSQGSADVPKTKKQSRLSRMKAVFRTPRIHGGAVAPPQAIVPCHDIAEATITQNPTDTEEAISNTTVASVVAPSTTSKQQNVPDFKVQPSLEPYSMEDLWDVAYDELRLKDRKLVDDYEHIIHGDLTAMLGATATFSGSKIQRKDLMQNLLARKIEEVKDNTWKLKFGGQEIPVKDLAKPVIGIISWADDYISGALEANPYASIAWAGVSLLLPLTLNPSKQASSLAKSLEYISDLIVRSSLREALFKRRYGSQKSEEGPNPDLSTIMTYADTLKSLYTEILKFQATTICYLSKNGVSRLVLDIVKWDDWDGSLSDVQKRETAFCQVYDIWKDVRHQEDWSKLYQQHQDKLEALGSVSYNIVALQTSIEAKQLESSRIELLDWLSSVDPSENYNSALRRRRDGTGEWLLQGGSDFDAWKTGHNSLLWLNGKAGSGKSILSASAIETLKDVFSSDPETALAYFYFSFNDGKKQDIIEMLSSIIKQLCCRRPDTPVAVEALRQYKTSGQRPDQKTLEKTLNAVIHGFTHVHIVIDALDECPAGQERIDLLKTIGRVLATKSQNLHLLLTSRREFDIEAALLPSRNNTSSECLSFDINLSEVPGVETDIAFNIDQEFKAEPFCSWPADVKEEAKSALIKNSDGMFQYVACQFDELRQHESRKDIREALRDLPNGLDATYDRMLNNIAPKYQQRVAGVLKWLAFSLRPLLVDELSEAFVLDPEKPVPFEEDERLFKPEDVLSYLAGFVVKVPVKVPHYYYREQSPDIFQIRFAHFSIKEYLCSTRMSLGYYSTAEELSHLYLAKSCLAYHLKLSKSTLATKAITSQYILWDYAAQNWPRHLEKINRQAYTDNLIRDAIYAFSANSQSLFNMIHIGDPKRIIYEEDTWDRTIDSLASPLYYTAALGLCQLTELLIDGGADVNDISPGRDYSTALQVAAFPGHEDVIKLLLENHADIDQDSGYFGTALQAAAYRESETIVQLLIDHGANVNAQGGNYGNALQAAALTGKETIVQLLINHGANINAQGGVFGNALQAAIAWDRLDIAELLLSCGAEVDEPGEAWEEVLLRIEREWGGALEMVERLRDFQEDPKGYIARRKKEIPKLRERFG